MTERLYLFDTTLRDGQQTPGIDFSLEDKILVAEMLDGLGVDYVEGGYPGANPDRHGVLRDEAHEAGRLHRLRHGEAGRALGRERSGVPRSSRGEGRCDLLRRQDLGLSRPPRARLHRTRRISSRSRSRSALRVPPDARRCSIASTSSTATRRTATMRSPASGRRWKPARAGSCSATPMAARCRRRSSAIVADVTAQFPGERIGIHAHNDTGQAVANSLAAVRAGARQIQGTLNGIGERCGNADLVSLIPTLLLKPDLCGPLRDGRVGGRAEEPDACVARLRRDPQPRPEPAGALCRLLGLRDEGRHPRLGDRQGAGDLRACRAGGGRQSCGACWSPTRPDDRT